MLKKTITFTDFNGNEASEDHFFHLSQAELVTLEMSHPGGLSASLERIIDAEDGKAIMDEFKKIILSSYGKKSADGRRFVKNQQVREEFESSEAYSTLFMELVTQTGKAIEFVNGIVPNDLTEQIAKLTSADLTVVPDEDSDTKEVKGTPRIVTKAELKEMSQEELQKLGSLISSGEVVIGELTEDSPTT